MNAWRFGNHLDDAMRVSGDVFISNLGSEVLKHNVLTVCKAYNKTVFTELSTKMGELCFIFLDTSKPIENELNRLWTNMSYGSTIFFSIFSEKGNTGNNAVIKKFLKDKEGQITSARQMLLNGIREVNLIVKCFPTEKRKQFPVSDSKITIATVFKTGGVYDVSYVNHIANSIKKNVTIPYEFVCLTDCFEGYNVNVNKILPFKHNFPKWWGKIELFSPGKFNTERIFYLDLDTMIVKNIDNIIRYNGVFFGLRDFYHQYGMGSGLMGWQNNNPIVFQIYERFMESPEANMINHKYGDQEYINKILTKHVQYVQDLYPKEVVSYKKDCINGIPEKAKIICFHGPPRPNQVKTPEISKYWYG